MFVAGFAGRAAALRKPGRSYSLYVDPAPTEALRTDGTHGRIREEEAALVDRYGDGYREYCRRTRRLLPWIW